MSKRTIGCPKCQKKYQVTDSMAGKKMKCPACQTVFELKLPAKSTTGAAAASQTRQTKPKSTAQTTAKDYKQMGLDGPLQGEPDLFPANNSPAPGQVRLDNYAADPGFGYVDPSRFEEDVYDPRDDNPLHVNPAVTLSLIHI